MFGQLPFRHGVLVFQREHGSLLQNSLDLPANTSRLYTIPVHSCKGNRITDVEISWHIDLVKLRREQERKGEEEGGEIREGEGINRERRVKEYRVL